MFRVLLTVSILVLLLMPVPAPAIPTCPAASMAEYVGFAFQGCQFNSLTFFGFDYSHGSGVRLGLFGPTVFPSLSEILVTPRSNPSPGSGGAALAIGDLTAHLQSIANRVGESQ